MKQTVRYLGFVVRHRDVRRVEPGLAANIDDAVKDWRDAITRPLPADNPAARQRHEAQLDAIGRTLRQLVWEPVQKLLEHFRGWCSVVTAVPDVVPALLRAEQVQGTPQE